MIYKTKRKGRERDGTERKSNKMEVLENSPSFCRRVKAEAHTGPADLTSVTLQRGASAKLRGPSTCAAPPGRSLRSPPTFQAAFKAYDSSTVIIHTDLSNTNRLIPPNAEPGKIYKPSHMFITSSSSIFR